MRVDGDDRVFLTGGLSAFDANVSLSAWINSQYVSILSENVTALTLENANGVFEFVKEGEEWVYLGLGEDETFNPQAFNTLLNQSTAVRMTAPISQEEDESFGMDEPRATITVTVTEIVEPEAPDTNATEEPTEEPTEEAPDVNATEEPTEPETVDTVYTLTVGSLVEEADFAFKASDQEYYVRVSTNTANGFVDRSHEGFLILPEEEPETTPGGE
jgi:hypothetical protein